MKYPTCLIFFICVTFNVGAQVKFAPMSLKEKEYSLYTDSLEKKYSHKKKITSDCHLQSLIALSYFPELENTRIKFKQKKIKSTAQARPTILSSFRNKKKRKYLIILNKNEQHDAPLYGEFTFNAKVGLIGHELAHISKFTETGFFKLLKDGIKYRKKEFKSSFEKDTDKRTIEHGLGWQIYDFSSQLQAKPDVPESYKEYKQKMYFTSYQIYDLMQELGYEM